jgi:large subunit ribosomal protein L19
MANIQDLHTQNVRTDIPDFRTGDTITVNVRVIEGNKERIQAFNGVVIQKKNSGISQTVTVRKMSGNVSVERIFPVHSPRIDSIILERKGKVHQSRIFYMRDRRGKAARIKERQKGL